jgi:phage/plasmid-associated DNA primase
LGVARTIIDTNGHLLRTIVSVANRNTDLFVWKDGWNSGADADTTLRNLMTDVINGPIKTAAVEAAEEGDKKRLESLKRITGKIRSGGCYRSVNDFVVSDERIRTREEDWDRQDHLLGLPRGRILDLSTGQVLVGGKARDAHCRTRITVDYDPTAYDPIVDNFLKEVHLYSGAEGGVDFLLDCAAATLFGKRVIGDRVILLHGPTGSGKSTFMDLLSSLLGTSDENYATGISHGLVIEGGFNNDSYSLAKTKGSRMFTLDELPRGKPLKDDVVKMLSGSTVLTARQIHRAEETIRNNGTLWIATNEPPLTSDDALWRRFIFISFPVSRADGIVDDRIKRTMLDPNRPLARQYLLRLLVERTPGLYEKASGTSASGLETGFDIPDFAMDYGQTVRGFADSFRAWVSRRLERVTPGGGEDGEPSRILYMDYRNFYESEGFAGRDGMLTAQAFRQKMKDTKMVDAGDSLVGFRMREPETPWGF